MKIGETVWMKDGTLVKLLDISPDEDFWYGESLSAGNAGQLLMVTESDLLFY